MSPDVQPGALLAETPHLRLHWLTPDDGDAIFRLLSDPLVMRFSSTGPMDRAASDAKLKQLLGDYRTHGWGRWKVVEKASGRFVGICGLLVWDDVDGRSEIEMGYRYLPEFWGKGYGTEAGRTVLDLSSSRFGLHRVISLIEAANVGSWRVAEKAGMQYEKDTTVRGIAVRVYAKEYPPSTGDRA